MYLGRPFCFRIRSYIRHRDLGLNSVLMVHSSGAPVSQLQGELMIIDRDFNIWNLPCGMVSSSSVEHLLEGEGGTIHSLLQA